MKRMMLVALASTAMSFLAGGPVSGQAVNDKPLTEHWWTSEFGRSSRGG